MIREPMPWDFDTTFEYEEAKRAYDAYWLEKEDENRGN